MKRVFALLLCILMLASLFPVSALADDVQGENPCAEGHSYNDGVTTPPTCTAAGYTTFTCTRCGDSYRVDGEAALGHSYNDGVTTPPTCTAAGYTTFTCTRCGDSYRVDGEAALGHSYNDGVVTDPTCTEAGFTTFTCSRCGDSYTTEGEAALDHDYGDGIMTDPTCTAAGFTTFTCSRCGDSYTTEGEAALGHDYDEGVVTTDPTAEKEGVKTVTCSRCGDTYTEPVPKLEVAYPAFSQSRTVSGVTVSVSAPEGVFPEGAKLSVTAVPAATAERDDNVNVALSFTFDIKVLDKDGEEVQPKDEQNVTVAFSLAAVADENLETQVYHIDDSGSASALDVDTAGQTVVVETDSFSLYQVEFTYEKKQYVLPGDQSVPLSEILKEVGLVGEVTDVQCSNTKLFSASNATGEWVVTANRAFSSTEWMKVTINNVVYEITVTDEQSGDWTIEIDEDGNAMITGYDGIGGALVIPEQLGDHPVTGIKASAFQGSGSITSVTIPASIASIGASAFSGCTGLSSVEFADGLGSISIGDSAFSGCTGLTTVRLSSRVTAIPDSMFQGCNSLTSVEFPANLTSIGASAFSGCSRLTSGDLSGTSMTNIGANAFSGCSRLAGLTFPSTSESLSIGDSAFSDCSSITGEVVIPANVTGIGASAFNGCTGLTGVTFAAGSGSMSIGASAFQNCSSLSSVTIPSSVTTIGQDAFYGCSKLSSVTIPSSVTTIGDYAFDSCGSLTSVTIPASVMNIGECAFQSCSNLRSVTIQRGDTNALVLGYGVFNVVPTDQATLSWTGAVPGDQDPVFTVTPDSAGYSIVNNTRLFWNGTTEEATLTASFAAAPTISTQPGSLSWTYGDTTVRTLSVAASVDDGGTLTYQWYQNTSASNTGGTEATGSTATASEYTVPSGTETNAGTYYYYCVVTNTNNGDTASTVSNVATVTVNKAPLTITAKDQIYEYNGQTQGPGDMAYDDAAEIAEVITADGLQGNDEVTSVTVDGQGTTVGTYPLEPSAAAIGKDGTKTNNYSISYENGTLRIANKYTVTVTASPEAGGTVTGGGSYLTSTEVTLTATPKTGYRFKEWQVVSGGVTIQDGKFTMGEKDVEVKAVFEAIAYPVTVSVNDSAMGTASASPASGPEGTEVTLTASPKSGYQFKEWQVVSGGVIVKDSKFTIGTSDVEVKAVFEVIPAGKVTVTFDANGHGTAPAAQQIEKGGKASKPADLTAKGWVFGGWYTSKDCKTAFDFSKAVNADTTVYAKWTKVVYTVVEGDFTRWWKGGLEGVSITVKRSPDDENCYAHFDSVDIDGKTLADSAYKAKKGSTVVYLKPATLEKLSLGRHTVTIVFDDGSAEAVVSIHRPHHGPKTGDGSTPGTWAALMLLSGCGFFSIVYTFSKKARKKET